MAKHKHPRRFIVIGTLMAVMLASAITLGKDKAQEPRTSSETETYYIVLDSYPDDNKAIEEAACWQMRAALSYLRQCERSMSNQSGQPCSVTARPIELEAPTDLDTVEGLRIEYEARKDTACGTHAGRRRLLRLKEIQ